MGQNPHSPVCADLWMETKSQGHLLSHLASQTLLLASWCQQDLETLPGLIFALLALAILVLFCLKGRVHLIMTDGCGSPLLTGLSQHTDQSPGDSSHRRNRAVSLLPPLADEFQEVKEIHCTAAT